MSPAPTGRDDTKEQTMSARTITRTAGASQAQQNFGLDLGRTLRTLAGTDAQRLVTVDVFAGTYRECMTARQTASQWITSAQETVRTWRTADRAAMPRTLTSAPIENGPGPDGCAECGGDHNCAHCVTPRGASTEEISLEGMHRLDGVIYKVQAAVQGSGNLYAKRLVLVESGCCDGTHEDCDGEATCITYRAGFEFSPGAVRKLSASTKMTLAEAKEFGALYGTCCVCGRTLTDEDSIAAGIGPVCATKF